MLSEREIKTIELAFLLTEKIFNLSDIADVYVVMAELTEIINSKIEEEELKKLHQFYQLRSKNLTNLSTFKEKMIHYAQKESENKHFEIIAPKEKITYSNIMDCRFEKRISMPAMRETLVQNLKKPIRNKIPHGINIDENNDDKIILYSTDSHSNNYQMNIPLEYISKNFFKPIAIKSNNSALTVINFQLIKETITKLEKLSWARKDVILPFIEHLHDNNLQKLSNEELEIPIENTNLILAPTGKGKSIFMKTFVVSHEISDPIIILLDEIQECFKWYEDLTQASRILSKNRKIELFIGKSGRYKYLNRFLKADFSDKIGSETVSILRKLTYTCKLNRFVSNDKPFLPCQEPCFRLKEQLHTRKTIRCPFIGSCSKFDIYRNLAEADIIITTKMGFLKGNFPLPVSISNEDVMKGKWITFLEFALKKVSIILIDEIETFLQSVGTSLSNKLDLDEIFRLITKINKGIRSGKIPRHTRITDVYGSLSKLDQFKVSLEENIALHDIYWPKLHSFDNNPRRITLTSIFSELTALSYSFFKEKNENADKLIKLILKNSNIEENSKNPKFKQFTLLINQLYTEDILQIDFQKYEDNIYKEINKLWLKKQKGHETIKNSYKEKIFKKIRKFAKLSILHTQLNRLKSLYVIALQHILRLTELNIDSFDFSLERFDFSPLLKVSPYGCFGKLLLAFSFEPGEEDTRGKLKISTYSGNPHKIVKSLGYEFSSFLVNRQIPVLGFSATAYFPYSPSSHVFGNPFLIHPDSSETEFIDIANIRIEDKNDKLIKISGSSFQDRRENMISLINELGIYIDQEIIALEQRNDDRARILLVTNSYRETIWVCEGLLHTKYKNDFKLILNAKHRQILNNAEIISHSIDKSQVRNFVQYQRKLLIAPLGVISRAVNVLNNQKSASAFGAIYLLVRTLPNPDDLTRELMFINYHYFNRLNFHQSYDDTPGLIFKKQNRLMHGNQKQYLQSLVPFSNIPHKLVLLGIVADVIVEFIQLMGRGRRSRKNSEKYPSIKLRFIDGAFSYHNSWKNLVNQLFQTIQENPRQWSLFKIIYTPILDAFLSYIN